MNGDLSRASFDPTRYSRVVAQQGRAQLDSDWNEQQAIIDYRLRALVADVFGHADPSGVAGLAVVPAAKPGYGLHVHGGGAFDGTSSYEDWIPPERSGGNGPLTVGMWIAPAALHKPGAFGTIVACRGAYAIAVDADGHVVFRRFENDASDGAAPAAAERTLTSRVPLRTDGFSFVACVFTGDAKEIWIDGTLAGRCVAGPGPSLEASPVRVGAAFTGDKGAPSDFFHGTIEEVVLRHRRMVQNEIVASVVHRSEHDGGHGSRWTFRAGTALQPAQRRLCASPGRAYVDGRLCENAHHTDIETPPHGKWVAYLDVWERYVSAFEDEALLEPALGGTDTTGRVQTVAHVRIAGAAEDASTFRGDEHDAGQIAVEAGSGFADDNLLYRFEIHAPASAGGGAAVAVTVDDPNAKNVHGLRTLHVTGDAVDWQSGQFLVAAGAAAPVFRVVSRDAGGRTFTVAELARNTARSLNVHPVAALLWCKQNGSVVFALHGAHESDDDGDPSGSSSIKLKDEAGRSDLLSIGDVVVLADPADAAAGRPGFLSTIVSVTTDDSGTIDVVVAGRAPALPVGTTLRRWDGVLPAITNDALGAAGAQAGGLNVRFAAGGAYRTGDGWVAALRTTADRQLDWPADPAGGSAFLPPAGSEHVYAPLAVVRIGADGPSVERDLRRIMHSIGDLSHRAELDLARDVERDLERARTPPEPALSDADVGDAADDIVEDVAADVRPEPEPARAPPPAPPPVIIVERIDAVPADQLVLARSLPDGYSPAGSVVDAVVEHPVWRAVGETPESGAADAVTLDAIVYVLFATGALWRYDPRDADQPWSACASYGLRRRGYALAAADGRLLLIGGYDARGNPSALVDAYDPRHDTWTEGWSSMRVARAQPIAAAAGDTVVVCGGIRSTWFGARYATQTAELYDAGTETWRMLEPMPFRRYGAAAACAGESLYVAGGALATELLARVRRTARVDRLNLRSGRWASHARLRDTRMGARAVAVGDGEILVLGGAAGGSDAGGERVSTRGDDVRRLASPGRENAGLAALDGTAYAIAGTRDGEPLAGVHACTLLDRMHVYRRRTDLEET